MLKEVGFKQNLKACGLVKISLEQAKEIPNAHVEFLDDEKYNARVKSQRNDSIWYNLSKVKCEWSCCNCD